MSHACANATLETNNDKTAGTIGNMRMDVAFLVSSDGTENATVHKCCRRFEPPYGMAWAMTSGGDGCRRRMTSTALSAATFCGTSSVLSMAISAVAT